MNIKELAEQAGCAEINLYDVGKFIDLNLFAELVAAAERDRCIDIIEHYQIHVGGSAAGEVACEMTYMALRDIRDEIKGERNE